MGAEDHWESSKVVRVQSEELAGESVYFQVDSVEMTREATE